jgi:hypothetical protein
MVPWHVTHKINLLILRNGLLEELLNLAGRGWKTQREERVIQKRRDVEDRGIYTRTILLCFLHPLSLVIPFHTGLSSVGVEPRQTPRTIAAPTEIHLRYNESREISRTKSFPSVVSC